MHSYIVHVNISELVVILVFLTWRLVEDRGSPTVVHQQTSLKARGTLEHFFACTLARVNGPTELHIGSVAGHGKNKSYGPRVPFSKSIPTVPTSPAVTCGRQNHAPRPAGILMRWKQPDTSARPSAIRSWERPGGIGRSSKGQKSSRSISIL